MLEHQTSSFSRGLLRDSLAIGHGGRSTAAVSDRNLGRFLELAGIFEIASAAWLCPLEDNAVIGGPLAQIGQVSLSEIQQSIGIASNIPNLIDVIEAPLWLPGDGNWMLCAIGDTEAGRALLFFRHRAWHPVLRAQIDQAAERIRQLVHMMWVMRNSAATDTADLAHENALNTDALVGPLADQCPFGIMIMDIDQHLDLANECARKLLDERNGMGLVENRLVIADSNDAIRVQVNLRAVLMGNASITDRRTIAISGPDGTPLLLCISKLADGPNGPRACLILTRPGSTAEPDIHPLAELFGLTPVETRLVSQLVRGLSLKEAARALQLKVETVRTYLKQVFQKTGTHRQVELVQLMQNGAMPVLT